MSQTLLLELGCEELPARQIQSQAELLLGGLLKRLQDAGLVDAVNTGRWLATPRRLAILIDNVNDRQADRVLERKGPTESAAFDDQGQPTQAALGFARSVGLNVDALDRLQNDQGRWLFAKVNQPGKRLAELLPEYLEQTVREMAGARSMRWSDRSDKFLRPVRWLVSLHGSDVIPLELFGLSAGRETQGHRVHSPGQHAIEHAQDYETVLQQAFVLADFAQRRVRIYQQVLEIEQAENLRVNAEPTTASAHDFFADKANTALLDEVCGLVEWPVAVVGSFESEFLEVPTEALVSAMREHQKCFALYDDHGALAPKFITIANIESTDSALMTHGFERVIRPRLADAQFFYQQDLKQPLISRFDALNAAVFHPKLGSLADKSKRVMALSKTLADAFVADPDITARAAELAKCDLMTQMVGEFPDLQGTMGRHYAIADGEDAAVAVAIESHYQPRYAADRLPEDPIGQTLAVAERLDTLVGIFAAGQKPRGSKDPFALRRAALALVRILDQAETDRLLPDLIDLAAGELADTLTVDALTRNDVETFMVERMQSWLATEFAIETNTLRAAAAHIVYFEVDCCCGAM
ncbi:MAG: glycine--tRNA ligase subunit beta [Pseudomonadota bacterium]